MGSWEYLATFLGLPFLTGLPAHRRSVSCPQHSSSPLSTATATNSPSFFFFHCQTSSYCCFPRRAERCLRPLPQQRQTIGNLTFRGPSRHTVRNCSPACLSRQPLYRLRPLPPPTLGSSGNVSFQTNERGDGRQPLNNGRQRHMFSVLRQPITPNTIRSYPSRGRRQP